jgi:hypothetical protein
MRQDLSCKFRGNVPIATVELMMIRTCSAVNSPGFWSAQWSTASRMFSSPRSSPKARLPPSAPTILSLPSGQGHRPGLQLRANQSPFCSPSLGSKFDNRTSPSIPGVSSASGELCSALLNLRIARYSTATPRGCGLVQESLRNLSVSTSARMHQLQSSYSRAPA